MARTSIVTLLVLLILVLLGMVYLVSYQEEQQMRNTGYKDSTKSENTASSDKEVKVLNSELEKRNSGTTTIMAIPRTTVDITQEEQTVVFTEDGNIYLINNGRVLVSDAYVNKNNENTRVLRLENMRLSQTSQDAPQNYFE